MTTYSNPRTNAEVSDMTTEATEKRALADEDKQAIAALAAALRQVEEVLSTVDGHLLAADRADQYT